MQYAGCPRIGVSRYGAGFGLSDGSTYAIHVMQRLVVVLTAALVLLGVYTIQKSGRPDARLINLAVRATVYAMPSPTPRVIEVTRVVEVTRMVEVVREVTATPAPTATPTPTEAPSPTPIAAAPVQAAAAGLAAIEPEELAAPQETDADQEVAVESAPVQAKPVVSGCPVSSDRSYTLIPVAGGGAEHPDSQHGDLNLALRGYEPVDATLGLVSINGPTDGDAPQFANIFTDGRTGTHVQAYRVYDWNWGCSAQGCRGNLLSDVEVSMIGLAASPGEALRVPSRSAEIYGGGYVAMVLYAAAERLTVVYTREDSVANGYAVHFEGVCVDPNLVSQYQAANRAGRGSLPAVRNGDVVATAATQQVMVAIRDRGRFHDPRSSKDWWQGR